MTLWSPSLYAEKVWIGHFGPNQIVSRMETSLLRRLQAQTLPDEAPLIGKIHQFGKIIVTLEPVKQFGRPSGFRIS